MRLNFRDEIRYINIDAVKWVSVPKAPDAELGCIEFKDGTRIQPNIQDAKDVGRLLALKTMGPPTITRDCDVYMEKPV